MPDTTLPVEVPPAPLPQVVTETVTVSEVAPALPSPPVSTEAATAVLDEDTDKALRELLDGINSVNTQLEGGDTAVTGPLVLDPDQFGALGLALVLVIALLAALLIIGLRR